jgi:hypothetical protein
MSNVVFLKAHANTPTTAGVVVLRPTALRLRCFRRWLEVSRLLFAITMTSAFLSPMSLPNTTSRT